MKKIIYSIIAVILVIGGRVLLRGDYIAFLQWWEAVFTLGIIFMPMTTLIMKPFHDKGYLFSKVIGIAIAGYLMWLFSSLHLLRFNQLSCYITVIICLVFNLLLLLMKRKHKKSDIIEDTYSVWKSTLDSIISEELLFFGLFLFFTYIRGFKPEAYGTEKFMDYGFMTSMMRSDYMPPQDFWFSGTKLNYYYVGQYLATFLTRYSLVKVELGYNLMLMMVGAFAFILPYSLVYQLTLNYIREQKKKLRALPAISGLIGGAAVCFAGNMHYPTYMFFEPLVRKFFGMEEGTYHYWFPDATRFIGYHPETTDKTIHEFPAYSFVLGDLHAHVINIMFVLTVLGILLAWSYSRKELSDQKMPLWKEVFHPAILLVSFFIGLFHTTNFWDFPIYFIVSGAIILFTNLAVYRFSRNGFLVTALQGIAVVIISKIIALPFTLNFDQISTNINLVEANTPLNQLIILWGLPIFIIVSFLCFSIADFNRYRNDLRVKEPVRLRPAFFHYFEEMSLSDQFIILTGLCAIGLVLLPEIFYVVDIYSGDYKRANTMFKLTYQAFIMFGIGFGYIFTRLLCFGHTRRQRRVSVFGLILFGMSLLYMQNAVNAWYGNIFDWNGYQGINAADFVETDMPEDAQAIQWLKENVKGTPVVLEANGDSYTDYQRVSVLTGLPTVLGWRTHEWLWKSDTVALDERAADIEEIYTSTEKSKVMELIEKYHISYIYVGKLEYEKFEFVNDSLIKSLGDVVFSSPTTLDHTNETYIVKINNN